MKPLRGPVGWLGIVLSLFFLRLAVVGLTGSAALQGRLLVFALFGLPGCIGLVAAAGPVWRWLRDVGWPSTATSDSPARAFQHHGDTLRVAYEEGNPWGSTFFAWIAAAFMGLLAYGVTLMPETRPTGFPISPGTVIAWILLALAVAAASALTRWALRSETNPGFIIVSDAGIEIHGTGEGVPPTLIAAADIEEVVAFDVFRGRWIIGIRSREGWLKIDRRFLPEPGAWESLLARIGAGETIYSRWHQTTGEEDGPFEPSPARAPQAAGPPPETRREPPSAPASEVPPGWGPPSGGGKPA